MKSKKNKDEPTLAAGGDEALERSAKKDDVKKGHYTRVTKLSYDEVEPS
jgi:hypothetical protein